MSLIIDGRPPRPAASRATTVAVRLPAGMPALRAAVTRLEPCEEHQRCTSNFAWIFEDGWLARIVGRNELADALEAAGLSE